MKLSQRLVVPGLVAAMIPLGVIDAGVASADCTSSGATTICAQGDVRGGGGPDAPYAGPVYPGYCEDPWYCSDDWDLDVDLNPRPPVINPRPPADIGRPGRPGGGGGGRPGRG